MAREERANSSEEWGVIILDGKSKLLLLNGECVLIHDLDSNSFMGVLIFSKLDFAACSGTKSVMYSVFV